MKGEISNKVAELLLRRKKGAIFASHKKKLDKVETRKIHPEYLIPEPIKYQREEILKRDFVFRKENQGGFRHDYMSTMFEMLYYNKKNYYINRNQLHDLNQPTFASSEYPNLLKSNNEVSPPVILPYKKKENNISKDKSRNHCKKNAIALTKTYSVSKGPTEEIKEEDYSFSFDSTVKEKYDPAHKVQKQLRIFGDLCRNYPFFNRKEQIASPLSVSTKKVPLHVHSHTQTPSKRAQARGIYSPVNRFQLTEDTPKQSSLFLTPNQVLSSKIFLKSKVNNKTPCK